MKKEASSYEDKCHSSSGNQLVNAFRAPSQKPRGSPGDIVSFHHPRPFLSSSRTKFAPSVCVCESERSCLSQKLFNYQIKFNAFYSLFPTRTSRTKASPAFDPTKSFNNCKLLSQICLRTRAGRKVATEGGLRSAVWVGGLEEASCLWGRERGRVLIAKDLPAYLGKHFSHFGIAFARDQIFKGIRRESHSEFGVRRCQFKFESHRYRHFWSSPFAPLHSKWMSLSSSRTWRVSPGGYPSTTPLSRSSTWRRASEIQLYSLWVQKARESESVKGGPGPEPLTNTEIRLKF